MTTDSVRKTLAILSDVVELAVHEVATGTRVYDWTVPLEWNIRDAFVADESGNKLIDFKNSNLHVVGYSTPVDKMVPLRELEQLIGS